MEGMNEKSSRSTTNDIFHIIVSSQTPNQWKIGKMFALLSYSIQTMQQFVKMATIP